MGKIMKFLRNVLLIVIILIIAFKLFIYDEFETLKKPVIYLYPEKNETVEVALDYSGELTCTYPKYENGWKVEGTPSGALYDCSTGYEYAYLYWEGQSRYKWHISEGFVVAGEDTVDFLREKLSYLGLTPNEYNEFIVYWLPEMERNPYNLIYFPEDEYTEQAKLKIEPKPDSLIRVFMVFKPLEHPVEIQVQQLHQGVRKGFTVVEWGGTEIR